MVPHELTSLQQCPDLRAEVDRIHSEGWPAFMLHDPVANQHWGSLFSEFPDYQLVLTDEARSAIAVANTIPLVWNGDAEGLPVGWDAALQQGVVDYASRRAPTTLCALAIVVARGHLGKGLSVKMVSAMRELAARSGFDALIAPVRPTLKSRYPLTPMERYVAWTQPDGSPFDPWLRVHWRLGARVLKLAPQSMAIDGTVSQWEEWAAMRFPDSGAYVVPGALQPVRIDCERNVGRYEDPNVWMCHEVP